MENITKFLFINNYKIKTVLNYKTKINTHTPNLKAFKNNFAKF